MDISFLENGNYEFKPKEIDKNLRALLKAMGIDDSEQNMKIYKAHLGFNDNNQPLTTELFKDYYKRTLKIFMDEMKKEAKKKLEKEGKQPVLDGKDIMHKFDNLMHSIGEKRNYDLAKEELAKKSEKAPVKTEPKANGKTPVKVQETVTESAAEKAPKKGAKGKAAPVAVKPLEPKKASGGGPVSDMQQDGYIQGKDYYWSKFIDFDPNEKDPVEEYMRRQRTFGRFVVEHYTNYDNNLISNFFKKAFRTETSSTPTGYYDFDPSLMNEIHKREMFDLMEITLDEKGKVSNMTQFKDSCKKVAHYFLRNVVPNKFFTHTDEEITSALEEADKITKVKAPKDTKLHHHLGMSDSNFNELKNQMVFENAFYSLKWIYCGTYDKPLETIKVKKNDLGENKSKAFLAVNLLKGMKEIYDKRSAISKLMHGDELEKINEFQNFLVQKAGISERFISNELIDPELADKMRAKVLAEDILKASKDAEKEIDGINKKELSPEKKAEIEKETNLTNKKTEPAKTADTKVKSKNLKIDEPQIAPPKKN